MDYAVLKTRLEQADCLGKTDAEATDLLNAATVTEVYSRFGSFRSAAVLLTAEEYAATKTAIENAAAGSVLVADMLAFLKLPGDEAGNGGGIDFGNDTVRTMIDQLCAGEVAAKLKAYAERAASPASVLGLGIVTWDDVQRAREMI